MGPSRAWRRSDGPGQERVYSAAFCVEQGAPRTRTGPSRVWRSCDGPGWEGSDSDEFSVVQGTHRTYAGASRGRDDPGRGLADPGIICTHPSAKFEPTQLYYIVLSLCTGCVSWRGGSLAGTAKVDRYWASRQGCGGRNLGWVVCTLRHLVVCRRYLALDHSNSTHPNHGHYIGSVWHSYATHHQSPPSPRAHVCT
ncbi:hypothetical protein BC826DRAFT_1157613 [Russula brevipes]|nr:hypothetical protein BC826DRAFT_1157613 [Russula brevipes]